MGARKKRPARSVPATPDHPAGERELIMVGKSDASLRATKTALVSDTGVDVSAVQSVLGTAGAVATPLFGETEERLREEATRGATHTGMEVPDLSVYYRVEAMDEDLEDLCDALNACDEVEGAYIKPPVEPAEEELNEMTAVLDDAPPTTPDYSGRQIYLNAAPAGVDARYAWTVPGGRGAGVEITDIEGAWRFTHEDLRRNQGGVVGGTQFNSLAWRNHGTAVLGEYGGDRNTMGITGICPDARCTAVAIGGIGSAAAIRLAANRLHAGDIILIELHRAGPRNGFQARPDQAGYIAIEWWPDDFDAIRFATSRGILVVEAAGNGAESLDDPIYNQPAPGFPAGWTNPFNRSNRDSGAIVVGAGAPPPGTHGRNHGPDRSRLGFSNYGAVIDAQGWGREVTTCGYGDLQGGQPEDLWYTDRFSGTSSASPIIVGTLGCMQGARRAANLPVLSPAQARAQLRATGSPQTAAPGRPVTQRIGNRPNLRQILPRILNQDGGEGGQGRAVTVLPLFRYWNRGRGDHFYTTNWAELRAGRSGWALEGIQCYIFPRRERGTVPLYRYWNPNIVDHFYTTNWNELGGGRYGWRYEGVQGHVFSRRERNTTPLYRYWNPGIGDHFYTTNYNELRNGRAGWRFEGIQCYVVPQAAYLMPSTGTPETASVEPTEEVPASFAVVVEEAIVAEERAPEDSPDELTYPVGMSDAFSPEGETAEGEDSFHTNGPGNGHADHDRPTTIHLNFR